MLPVIIAIFILIASAALCGKLDHHSWNNVYQVALDSTAGEDQPHLLTTIRELDRSARQFVGDLPLWKYRLSRHCYSGNPQLRKLLLDKNQLSFTEPMSLPCHGQLVAMLNPNGQMWRQNGFQPSLRTIPDIYRLVWLMLPASQAEIQTIVISLYFTHQTLRSLIIRSKFNLITVDRHAQLLVKALMQLSVAKMKQLELNHQLLTAAILPFPSPLYYWAVVKRLVGLEELCVHSIIDNFIDHDWIDVAAQALADKPQLLHLSLHWEMQLDVERGAKLAERILLLPFHSNLQHLTLQGPGGDYVIAALGGRISQFQRLQTFECFAFDLPANGYPFEFVQSLLSIPQLERVHLPSLPTEHAANWRTVLHFKLLQNTLPFQLSFSVPNSQPGPLRLIWSIRFPSVSLVPFSLMRQFVREFPGRDPAFGGHFELHLAAIKGLQIQGKRLVATEFDIAALIPADLQPANEEFRFVESVYLKNVPLESLKRFAERVRGLSALEWLRVEVIDEKDCAKWSDRDVTLKFIQHPALRHLELSFTNYEPLHLLPILGLLSSDGNLQLTSFRIHIDAFLPTFVGMEEYLRAELLRVLPKTCLNNAEITIGDDAFDGIQWNRSDS